MVVGAVLGSVNGALVAFGGVPAIIVTLGTLAVFRTLLSLYSGGVNVITVDLARLGSRVQQPHRVHHWGFEVSLVFVITIAVVLGLQLVLARVRWGRRLYAIGSNPSPAAQAGLPAASLVFWSFVGSGALAGLAGFMYLARVGTISAAAGAGLELDRLPPPSWAGSASSAAPAPWWALSSAQSSSTHCG